MGTHPPRPIYTWAGSGASSLGQNIHSPLPPPWVSVSALSVPSSRLFSGCRPLHYPPEACFPIRWAQFRLSVLYLPAWAVGAGFLSRRDTSSVKEAPEHDAVLIITLVPKRLQNALPVIVPRKRVPPSNGRRDFGLCR